MFPVGMILRLLFRELSILRKVYLSQVINLLGGIFVKITSVALSGSALVLSVGALILSIIALVRE